MAHFEEKILAYLDGSLSEADRQDVLAKISSEHGSERELFDAHLRLQDLYSSVRTPVSAPLALQRELASQIPVLAIKLPYLAAPAKRDRFATGWLSSIRSSWVNMILLFAAALLAGGVWYAVKTNTHREIASTSTNAVAGGSLAGSSSAAIEGNTMQNMASSPTSVAQGSLHGTNAPYAADNSSSGHAGNIIPTRSTNARNISGNRNANRLVNAKGTSTTQGTQNNNSLATPWGNAPTSANSPSAITPSANGNSPKPADPQDLPPLPLHPVDVAAQPAIFQLQYTPSIINPNPGNSSDFTPLIVYAYAGSRLLMPTSNLSQYVIDNGKGITNANGQFEPAYEAGAEYEITPWTSAGVRLGLTNFAQYQSIQHNTISPVYSQYSDVDVVAVPALWAALAVTETFNPEDRMRYSLSLAGGPAFTAPVAWMGMAEAGVSYDLSPTLMLRLGASYDMEQVKQSSSGTASAPPPTAGFITSGTGGTLSSRALGLNLGISFHP